MDGDLELIYEDSNSRASCLSTASTECGSPSQVTSCTPQSLVEDSLSEQGSPSSSSRAAASAHAPFSLETAPASQRSTAVYPLPAVKPAGWEETAAYDEQNELHRDVLELLFDLILLSRASVKTGSIDSAAKPDALAKSATSGSSAPPVSFFRIRGAAAKQLLSHLLPGSQDEPSSLKPAPSAPVHENMLQTLANPSIETVVKNVWLACFGSPVGLRKKCPSEAMKMLFSAPRGSRAVLSISTERRGNLQQMLTSWKDHGLELPDELRKKLDLTKNARAELVLNGRIDFENSWKDWEQRLQEAGTCTCAVLDHDSSARDVACCCMCRAKQRLHVALMTLQTATGGENDHKVLPMLMYPCRALEDRIKTKAHQSSPAIGTRQKLVQLHVCHPAENSCSAPTLADFDQHVRMWNEQGRQNAQRVARSRRSLRGWRRQSLQRSVKRERRIQYGAAVSRSASCSCK